MNLYFSFLCLDDVDCCYNSQSNATIVSKSSSLMIVR